MVPRVFSPASGAPGWRLRSTTLGMLALAGAVGLLISMVALLPTVAHMPESPRSVGASYKFASSYAWPDVRYLLTLIAADWFGVEDRGSWFGAFNHWEMAGYYAGALVVLLAPLALWRWRKTELVGLAVVSLCAIGLAFSNKGPFIISFTTTFHSTVRSAARRAPS